MKKFFSLLICFLVLSNFAQGSSFSKIKSNFYRNYNNKDYSKRISAVEKLAHTGRIEALKILVTKVLRVEPDQYVFEETANFIVENFKNEKAYQFIGSQIARGHWKVQLALCRLAGKIKATAITEGLLKALKAGKWQVRSAAITAIRKHRSKKAIPILIDRLSKEKGRLNGEVVSALKDLTGADLGSMKVAWKSWWEANKASFSPSTRRASSGSRSHTSSLKTVLRKGMYGSVVSFRVVFILDISGSMLSGTELGKRIDIAKSQLKKVIKGLSSRVQFNVIAYDGHVRPWKKRMVKASSSNKTSIVKWISNIRVDSGGLTATYDALEFVFKHDKKADTVYLLSDGSPTAGAITDPTGILSKIKQLNRNRNLLIHTIAFLSGGAPGEDKDGASSFMKDLAEGNSGKFKRIE